MKRTLIYLLPAAMLGTAVAQGEPGPGFFLEENQRVVFLGDSVTAAGDYIACLDTALMTRWPDRRYHLINLGLSSETASGLSEPKHPWPRPCVHERLDRVLAKTKPDVVAACYGINDGIYYPFSEERFAAYKDGINRLVAKVKQSGAKIILITPVPFDAGSVPKSKLLPAGAKEYNWMTPYGDYDKVMEKYSAWIMSQKDQVDLVIDMHTAVNKSIAEARRKNPDYRSGDGVHPNAQGHVAIAEAVLAGLGISDKSPAPGIRLHQLPNPKDPKYAEIWKLIMTRHRLLSKSYLEHVGHKRPGNKGKVVPLEDALKEGEKIEQKVRKIAGGLLP